MTGVAAALEPDAARIGRRRVAAVVAIAAVAFGAAYGIGSATKQTTRPAPAGTLAPVTSVAGAQHASVTAIAGGLGVPALLSKPKAKAKAKAKASSSTTSAVSTATTSNSAGSGGTVAGGGSTGGGSAGSG